MRHSPILKIIPLMLITGCVETMQQVNNDLATFNKALAGQSTSASKPALQPATPLTSSGPVMSQAQLEQLDAALTFKSQNRELVQAVSEAAPVIKNFLRTNACIPGYNGSALNLYAAPGKSYSSYGYIGAPMPLMRYHHKSICASVIRVHDWKMPARNALSFEVVYHADDSGETVKGHHVLVKQPSNEWLFTR